MSRFQPQAQVNALTKSMFEEVRALTGGEPPNILTSMAVRPDIAVVTWNMYKRMLLDGSLPGSVVQLVFLVVSKQADCRYCNAIHAHALEAMGIPSDMVAECVRDPMSAPLPELHRDILLFAKKAAGDPRGVTEEDVDQLRESGLSDEELVELGVLVAISKFFNTWADATGVELDRAA